MDDQGAALDEAAWFDGAGLLAVEFEGERSDEGAAAEAHVGDHRAVAEVHAQHHVYQRSGDVVRDLPAHAGDQLRHGEAEGAEHIAEEGILFKTIAATAGMDEFVFDGREIDADGAAEEDVEVFVRDGARVVLMDRGQGRERHVARSGVGDAGEVGLEIGGGHRHAGNF